MKQIGKLLTLALALSVLAIIISVGSVRVFADTGLTYGGADAVTALDSALEAAASGNVTLTLESDMVFSGAATVGTSGSIPAGTVTVDGGGSYGLVFEGSSAYAVKFYGKFVFRNVDIKNNFASATDNAGGPWMVFPEGSALFDTEVTGSGSADASDNRVSVAGADLTFNSGSYKTVAGNVNHSEVNVGSVSIAFQGSSTVGQLVGGSYNGTSTGLVTGYITLSLGGSARFTDRAVGGSWYSSASNGGGTFTCGTTASNGFIVAGSIGGVNARTGGAYATYRLTVNSGTYNHYSGLRIHNGGATSNANVEITINGGTFSAACYGGVEPTDTAANTHNGYCKTKITGGTFNNNVVAGSWIRNNSTSENSDTELEISGGTLKKNIVGASLSSVTSRGGCGTHIGDSLVKITGGSFTPANSSTVVVSAGGYYLAAYNGNTTLTVEGGTFAATSANSNYHVLNAGVYGYGTMVGNSTMNIGGSAVITDRVYVYGGCQGVETTQSYIDELKSTYKQTGNVTVNFYGNPTVNAGGFYGGGRQSNVDGNVTVNCEGGTFTCYVYALSATSTYSRFCSCSGDVKVYIKGGTFNKLSSNSQGAMIYGGGYGNTSNSGYYPSDGVNMVGGNVYYEISGGSFADTTAYYYFYVAGRSGAYGDIYLKFVGNSFNISRLYDVIPFNQMAAYLPDGSEMGQTYIDLSCVTLDSATYNGWFGQSWTGSGQRVWGKASPGDFDVVYPALASANSLSLTTAPSDTTYASGDSIDLSGSGLSITYGTTVHYNDASTSVSSLDIPYNELTAYDVYASCDEAETANAFGFKDQNGDSIDSVGALTTGFTVCAGSGESSLVPITNTSGPLIDMVYEGFSIRLTPDREGLRIKTSIPKAQKEATIASDGYELVEYGCLVAKTVYYPNALLTMENVGSKCVKAVNYDREGGIDIINADDGTRVYYTCVIMNIPTLNYDTALSFRPYLKYRVAGGGITTMFVDAGEYASPSGNLERSIRYVATQLRNDVREGAGYSRLTASEKAYIDSVVGEENRRFASASEIASLDALYAGRNAYHGDAHEHSCAGDANRTSDGYGSLAEWKTYMDKYSIDFSAILDHRQVSHMYDSDWDDSYFIGGTENGGGMSGGLKSATASNVHFNFLFADAQDLRDCLTDIPEFVSAGYNGEWDGHWATFNFTKERMIEIIQTVKDHGGVFVWPHPTSENYGIVSDDPLDYFFCDYIGMEVIYPEEGNLKGTTEVYNSSQTANNYKAWTDLLALGKRVWACASSDYHGPSYKKNGVFYEALPTDRGLTAIYSTSDSPAAYLDPYSKGDFAAGYCGVQMAIGDTLMGGATKVSSGDRLLVRAGDIYNAHGDSPVTAYRIDVIDKTGVIGSYRFDYDEPIYLSVPVTSDNFYRVEIFELSTGDRIGIGNPIWTEADTAHKAGEHRIDNPEHKNLSNGITPTSNFSSVYRIEMLTDGVTSAESISTCALAYRTLASNDTAFRARFGTGSSYTTSDGKTVTGLTSDSYFTIDLGQVCTVDSYKLYNYRYGRAYCMLESWKVVVSENGTDWTEVAYYSGNTFAVASGGRYNACVEERFEPTRARYVRLCAMGIYTGGETSASCDIRIPEFQIWGIEGTYGTKAPGTTTLKDNGFGVKAYGVSSDKLANAFDGNASTFTKLVFPNDALDVPFNVTSGDISGTDSITSYILTDLYEVTDVSGFDITFTANNTISGYYVLYTTDMTNWTAIRFDSLNAGAYSFVSDQSIRALAFAFTDSTEAEISEIDVF